MMNFQHVHNIRGARNTNAKCMYDILTTLCPDKTIEVLPAIITSYNIEDASKSSVVVSLVLLVAGENEEDKTLLDPAYDVFSLDNKHYYLNIFVWRW